MRIVETPVYDFTELSGAAKNKARAWFRERSTMTGGTASTTTSSGSADHWRHARHNDRPPHGRRHPPEALHLVFRVLVAGDGACFEGRYAYAPRASRRIRDYAPEDTELHRIADALQAPQRPNFYQLTASFRQTGRHYGMTADVDRDAPPARRSPAALATTWSRPCAISPTGSIARSSANTSFRPPTKPSTRAFPPMITPSPPKAGASAERPRPKAAPEIPGQRVRPSTSCPDGPMMLSAPCAVLRKGMWPDTATPDAA